ncbi:MAG TPA: hypothetical protein VG269_03025 [Tepidisphaeraceae bacterium]|jgi:hypothetical protein|nr:hypothetical protein [Tepidisphaeraceae bacterium]
MKLKRFDNVVHHAASGLQMPEALARRIEALSRGLPADFTYRRLARKSDALTLDPGERTDVSVITTDAIDRDGECVLPAGGDWSGYNRVVTFAHRYDQLPVGSNWWIRPKGPALVAKTHYPDRPADWGAAPWLPSAILHLMQQPVPTCTGKSIGFLPLNVRQATSDEIARRPALRGIPVIDRWVGVEYAVVPVPCNPDAEMQAVAKGMELGLLDRKLMELIADASGKWGVDSLASVARARRARVDPEVIRAQIMRHIRETFGQIAGRVG